MADTLIATRDGDRLFCTGFHLNQYGEKIFHGYIKSEDGARLDVQNIDVLISHGYWTEIID